MLCISSQLLKTLGKKYNKGATIFKEGDAGDGFFIIYSGKVAIVKQIKNEEKLLRTLKNDEFFGEMALLNNAPRSATAKALTDVEVLEIKKNGFETIMLKNPAISVKMVADFSSIIREKDTYISILVHRKPLERLVQYLYQQAKKVPLLSYGREISLNMEDTLKYLNITENEFNESINQLAQKKLIAQRGAHLIIQDEEKFLLSLKESKIPETKPQPP